MGVRPPAGGPTERETVEFGIAALVPMLEAAELEYPLDGTELVEALDDPDVPIDANGHTTSLSRAVGDLDVVRFHSERELLDALHPVFESYREDRRFGLLASVRGLLPP